MEYPSNCEPVTVTVLPINTATGVMLCDGASGIAGQIGDDWMLVYPNGTVTFYAGEYFRKHWREA